MYLAFGVIHQVPSPEQELRGEPHAENILEYTKLILSINKSRQLPFLFDHDPTKVIGKVITCVFHPTTIEATAVLLLDTTTPWGNFAFERIEDGTFTSLSTGSLSIARYCDRLGKITHSYPYIDEVSLVARPRRVRSDLLYLLNWKYIGYISRIYNKTIRPIVWHRHNMESLADKFLSRVRDMSDSEAREEATRVLTDASKFHMLMEAQDKKDSEELGTIGNTMKEVLSMNGFNDDEINDVQKYVSEQNKQENSLKAWRTICRAVSQTRELQDTQKKVLELEQKLENAKKVSNLEQEPERTIERSEPPPAKRARYNEKDIPPLVSEFKKALAGDPGLARFLGNAP